MLCDTEITSCEMNKNLSWTGYLLHWNMFSMVIEPNWNLSSESKLPVGKTKKLSDRCREFNNFPYCYLTLTERIWAGLWKRELKIYCQSFPLFQMLTSHSGSNLSEQALRWLGLGPGCCCCCCAWRSCKRSLEQPVFLRKQRQLWKKNIIKSCVLENIGHIRAVQHGLNRIF